MRITFFTNSLSREGGGLFHSVRLLAKTIDTAGHDVSVLAPSDPHLDQDRPAWDETRTYVYPRIFAGRARTELNQRPPDILHLNGIWLPHSQIARSFSLADGIPLIISPRGMLDPWALRNGQVRKKLAGWLYEYGNLRSAACIHALCESEYQAIRDFGLTQPVAVIPNGVASPPSETDRQALPWPYPHNWRGHPVLLFLSRIHPKKGLIPLVHAWHQIAKTGTKWRLAIVGPDENHHARDILTMVDELNLRSSLSWLGPMYDQDRDACYSHASALILPSFSEGFPMAALEALSFSLPAILTPGCHLPEARDAGAALITEPEETAIAITLRQLFALERSQLFDMGERGKRLVGSSFAWESIASRMINVYEWLMAPQSHPMPVDIRVG